MANDANTPEAKNRYFVVGDFKKDSKKKSKTAFGTGIATIVTVMVVLMLAVFSILSFAQSHSEMKLSKMGVEAQELYYQADTEAQTWLSELSQKGKAGNATAQFKIDEKRTIDAEVYVGTDGTIKVLKWQTVVNGSK